MNGIETQLRDCIGTITDETDDKGRRKVQAVCLFPASFTGFNGHFPDMPILPAIVQLAAVRHILEQVVDQPLTPVSFTRTKFRGMVAPEQEITISVSSKLQEGSYNGQFKISMKNGDPVSSGHVTLLPASEMRQDNSHVQA